MGTQKYQRTKFTLIEMLVVISIIAILASVFLPAMKSSMEHVRMISCLNTCKQLAVACNSYTNDYNGNYNLAAGSSSGQTTFLGGPQGSALGPEMAGFLLDGKYITVNALFCAGRDQDEFNDSMHPQSPQRLMELWQNNRVSSSDYVFGAKYIYEKLKYLQDFTSATSWEKWPAGSSLRMASYGPNLPLFSDALGGVNLNAYRYYRPHQYLRFNTVFLDGSGKSYDITPLITVTNGDFYGNGNTQSAGGNLMPAVFFSEVINNR